MVRSDRLCGGRERHLRRLTENSLLAPGIDTTNLSLGKTFHLFEGASACSFAPTPPMYSTIRFRCAGWQLQRSCKSVDSGQTVRARARSTALRWAAATMQISARIAF